MIFREPTYLWLLALLPFYLLLQNKMAAKKESLLKNILSPPLIRKFHTRLNESLIKKTLHYVMLSAVVVCLARPQWGETLYKNKQEGVALGFLIDLSNSMYATDIKPSRLKILQLEIANFLKKLNGDEVGLVGFANSAFIAAPLSTDYRSLEEYVFSLSPRVIRNQGTDIGNAVREGLKLFANTPSEEKALILISDGEDHGSTLAEAVSTAKKMGVRIYSVGLGTNEGSPIEIFDMDGKSLGYLKDKNGKIVVSKASFNSLKQAAEATGGRYVSSTTGDLRLDEIYEDIRKLNQTTFQEKKTALKEERYYVFMFIAFLAFVLEFFPEVLNDLKFILTKLSPRKNAPSQTKDPS